MKNNDKRLESLMRVEKLEQGHWRGCFGGADSVSGVGEGVFRRRTSSSILNHAVRGRTSSLRPLLSQFWSDFRSE